MQDQTEVLNISQLVSAKLVLSHHNEDYQYHEQRDILGITISRERWTFNGFLEYPSTIEIMMANPNVSIRHDDQGNAEVWNDACIQMKFSAGTTRTIPYQSDREAVAAFDELCSKIQYVKVPRHLLGR